NMAGRGTDILLGGNPDFMARSEMLRMDFTPEMIELATGHADTDDEEILNARKVYSELLAKHKKVTDVEHDRVIAAGGLHIIGTERHESRRIDNQLRGRAGRQGDVGSSQFFIALEDDIMRLFGGEKITTILERVGMDEEVRLEYGMLSRQIEAAQKRVEYNNFNIRKHVLQYDDVMNKQREIIYDQRRQVLTGSDMKENMLSMLDSLVSDAVQTYTAGARHTEDWDVEGLIAYCRKYFDLGDVLEDVSSYNVKSLTEALQEKAHEAYEAKEAYIRENGLDPREIERMILLRIVDARWMDHIDAMHQLRQGITLRAYGQTDPVQAYNIEGFGMFDQMIDTIRETTLAAYMGLRVEKTPRVRKPIAQNRPLAGQMPSRTPVSVEKKVGRNDPCPCGSGKKYKNCCGANGAKG
ncbi:MAG: SEC-C domain-containing protein, partial [Clostridia bacterium]|nr:SEC-C domain-containing protein [Clostridia bacterium]